jgi:hypothetical protein
MPYKHISNADPQFRFEGEGWVVSTDMLRVIIAHFVNSALSLIGGVHIGARALIDINLTGFAYIARLSHWGGGGYFYLPSLSLEGGGGQHPVGVCRRERGVLAEDQTILAVVSLDPPLSSFS